MFVVDFTRIDDEIDFDLIVGKDGGEARNKAINYIMDYAFANDGIYLDKKILDANFEPNDFSYKLFMKNVYDFDTNSDLITSGFYTDKDYSVFLKYVDINRVEDNYIYILHNDLEKSASKILALLINDKLIEKYADNLDKYKELELDPNIQIDTFKMDGVKASIISLYNGGLFLEELLNNAVSYNQVKSENIEGIPL